MKWMLADKTIELVQGDITEQDTDAIVNAANSQLIMGGGVAGAIRRKGGPSIQEECDQKAPVPVGGAVLTGAGNLKARYVIHAVGPRMGEGNEDRKLKQAALNSLKVADTHYLQSIAFCAISTGIFGYPIDRCARILLRTARDFLQNNPQTSLQRVVFCLFDRPAYETFAAALKELQDESRRSD
ncbi:MAG TPA: macro domain-containing protein [Anaerohalosphaeraceae bacterium]|nr:macro domain-containing protein [Anaerohalosphaeraceae bacterium]